MLNTINYVKWRHFTLHMLRRSDVCARFISLIDPFNLCSQLLRPIRSQGLKLVVLGSGVIPAPLSHINQSQMIDRQLVLRIRIDQFPVKIFGLVIAARLGEERFVNARIRLQIFYITPDRLGALTGGRLVVGLAEINISESYIDHGIIESKIDRPVILFDRPIVILRNAGIGVSEPEIGRDVIRPEIQNLLEGAGRAHILSPFEKITAEIVISVHQSAKSLAVSSTQIQGLPVIVNRFLITPGLSRLSGLGHQLIE